MKAPSHPSLPSFLPGEIPPFPSSLPSSQALDLFVGNEGGANELWINNNDGSGSFTAATGGPASGSAYTKAAAFGDVNGDGVR